MCLLEAVAFMAGEPHSDCPMCVCPILASFARTLNDSFRSDVERTENLSQFISKLAQTNRGPDIGRARLNYILNHVLRIVVPNYLDSSGHINSDGLRASERISDDVSVEIMRDLLRGFRHDIPQSAHHSSSSDSDMMDETDWQLYVLSTSILACDTWLSGQLENAASYAVQIIDACVGLDLAVWLLSEAINQVKP
ncbi:MAG: hypothetical protein EBY17_20675 [Acidobacteriia bacterium]|nr:hypothetical protein [Terriglobia bacterium]